jgi:hypothetical protein
MMQKLAHKNGTWNLLPGTLWYILVLLNGSKGLDFAGICDKMVFNKA